MNTYNVIHGCIRQKGILTLFDYIFSEKQIHTVFLEAIRKVIIIIASDAIIAIVEKTDKGTLSSASEICLQCSSACIQQAQCISVICPS